MKGFFKVRTPQEASLELHRYFHLAEQKTETVPLIDANGRVLAISIIAPENIPPFDRSTMDGYAVRAADTFGASEGLPAYLNVRWEVMMGEAATKPIAPGEAVKISTGGMLPPGADSVVMVEQTNLIDESLLEVMKAVGPAENVVRTGEDIHYGEEILTAGHRLRPQDLGALASLGITEAAVIIRPQVAIISTGDELVMPSVETKPGQIRDINSYTLAALVTQAGGIPVLYGIVKDDYSLLRAEMARALAETDVVLTSGGSSVGTRDLTIKVINDLGQPGVLVHGVSVSPGKPTILAVVDGKPVCGLPGHPVAVMTIFDLFVKPLLMEMGGLKQDKLPQRLVKGMLIRNIPSAPGREDFIRVAVEQTVGQTLVKPILGKSGVISTMVRADGIVRIPLERNGLEKGEEVWVTLF